MKQALRGHLLADPTIAALVDQRIAWAVRPRQDQLPSIALHRIDGVRDYTMANPSGLVTSRVQVDCWATTNKEADRISKAVNGALSGLRQVIGGVEFQGAFIEVEVDYSEEGSAPEELIHRIQTDYLIWHSE
jgi:Protein of unknown function (DUF3168)